jgi:hypothetical protein
MKLFEMEHNIVISIKDDTHAKKVLDKINYKKIHGVDPFFIENSKEAQEEGTKNYHLL